LAKVFAAMVNSQPAAEGSWGDREGGRERRREHLGDQVGRELGISAAPQRVPTTAVS
jgi:hypothetical protein